MTLIVILKATMDISPQILKMIELSTQVEQTSVFYDRDCFSHSLCIFNVKIV